MIDNLTTTLKSNIEARKEEVFGYQFNIDNFVLMLDRLPKDWDDEARAISERGPTSEEEALLLGRHKLRDDIKQRLINERVQLQTAQLVLDVLLARQAG